MFWMPRGAPPPRSSRNRLLDAAAAAAAAAGNDPSSRPAAAAIYRDPRTPVHVTEATPVKATDSNCRHFYTLTYRWRPCGATWDFVPNSRGNKAAANLRPIITFGARGNGHEYLLLSRSRPIYRALGVKFFLCGRATEKAISRTFYANDTAARPVARCGSLAIRRSLHLKRRRSVTVPMAAAILSLHSQCDSEAASLSE